MSSPIQAWRFPSPMSAERDPTTLSRRALLGALASAALPASRALAAATPRIVSLDYGLASTLLALGIVPIAISELADWDKFVVDPPMPKGVADLGSSLELNFEVLLALKPDLILTTPYLDDLLPRLGAISRVLRVEIYSEESGRMLPAAIKATRTLGLQIDRQAETEAYIARADALFEDCRRRLSQVARPPVVLCDFLDARHARVFSRPGLLTNVLERIGVKDAWPEASNYWGFQTIAIEELSKVSDASAKLIAFDPIPDDVLPKLKRSPLWQALPFAQPGHFRVLPPTLLFGMLNEAMRFARLITDLLEAET